MGVFIKAAGSSALLVGTRLAIPVLAEAVLVRQDAKEILGEPGILPGLAIIVLGLLVLLFVRAGDPLEPPLSGGLMPWVVLAWYIVSSVRDDPGRLSGGKLHRASDRVSELQDRDQLPRRAGGFVAGSLRLHFRSRRGADPGDPGPVGVRGTDRRVTQEDGRGRARAAVRLAVKFRGEYAGRGVTRRWASGTRPQPRRSGQWRRFSHAGGTRCGNRFDGSGSCRGTPKGLSRPSP